MAMGILTYTPGVTLYFPPTPGGARIQGTLEQVARLTGLPIQITCGSDHHPPTDPHMLGKAFDIRTLDWTPQQVLVVYYLVMGLLGVAFYGQYEGPTPAPRDPALVPIYVYNPGASAEHLHIQVAKGTMYP